MQCLVSKIKETYAISLKVPGWLRQVVIKEGAHKEGNHKKGYLPYIFTRVWQRIKVLNQVLYINIFHQLLMKCQPFKFTLKSWRSFASHRALGTIDPSQQLYLATANHHRRPRKYSLSTCSNNYLHAPMGMLPVNPLCNTAQNTFSNSYPGVCANLLGELISTKGDSHKKAFFPNVSNV